MQNLTKFEILGGLFSFLFLCFVGLFIRSCVNTLEEAEKTGPQEGDYVRIVKKMDNGDGKIGIVQHKYAWQNKCTVRYVKEVKYLNKEKTEWSVVYSDDIEYKNDELKIISKQNVVEEDGQFIER